jgi:hypothetical protein
LWAGWSFTGASVVEGAWSQGDTGMLLVVALGVEPSLPGGFSGRFELLAKRGHDGVAFPSSQGLSSWDAANHGGVGEVWLQWEGLSRVRVKAGWVDANTEFAAVGSAGEFANPSFGLSPALSILPSYPDPSPSANLFVGTWDGGPELGAGVFRSAPGAWSAVGQVSGGIARGRAIRWSAGWAVPLSGSPEVRGQAGGYLFAEGPSEVAVSPFAKVAGFGADVWHLAGGLAAPLRGAPLDARVGLAGSRVLDRVHGDETVTEVFLAVRPLAWVMVQADLQLPFAEGGGRTPGGLIRVVMER